jgi:hypothetical protein
MDKEVFFSIKTICESHHKVQYKGIKLTKYPNISMLEVNLNGFGIFRKQSKF